MTAENRVESPPEDLPRETIVIVGCVCGFIVLVLLVVLVVLCCRRHRAKKEDYVQRQQQPTAAVSVPAQPAVGEKRPNGLDNLAMDMVDFDDSTRKAGYPPAPHHPGKSHGIYGQANRMPRPPPRQEMAPPAYKDIDDKYSNHRDPEYQGHPRRDVINMDPPAAYTPDMENSDSGVSTPEVPVKPKKVIYEVIV